MCHPQLRYLQVSPHRRELSCRQGQCLQGQCRRRPSLRWRHPRRCHRLAINPSLLMLVAGFGTGHLTLFAQTHIHTHALLSPIHPSIHLSTSCLCLFLCLFFVCCWVLWVGLPQLGAWSDACGVPLCPTPCCMLHQHNGVFMFVILFFVLWCLLWCECWLVKLMNLQSLDLLFAVQRRQRGGFSWAGTS